MLTVVARWAGIRSRCTETCTCTCTPLTYRKAYRASSYDAGKGSEFNGEGRAGQNDSSWGGDIDQYDQRLPSTSRRSLDVDMDEDKLKLSFFDSSTRDDPQGLKGLLQSIQRLQRQKPRRAQNLDEKHWWETNSHHRQVSPHLPLVTRERNWLLSRLHHLLFFKGKTEWDPDKVWSALTQVLEYPDRIPNMPKSYFPLSTETTGDAMEDQRKKIKLTKRELRRLFTILASERPRTRKGFHRLLTVSNLIAQGENGDCNNSVEYAAQGREERYLVEVDGSGLRERDWQDLVAFAGLATRKPRIYQEMASAISLYSQYSKALSTESTAANTTLSMYNTLLQVALKSRHTEAFEHLQERMAQEGVAENHFTAQIRMNKAAMAGEDSGEIWKLFQEAVSLFKYDIRRFNSSASFELSETMLWNSMIWIMAQRGDLEEASKMYQAMRNGGEVNLWDLIPREKSQETPMTREPMLVIPPKCNLSTYRCLIQAYAFRGRLHQALRVLDDMIKPYFRGPSGELEARISPDTVIYTFLFKGFVKHGVDELEAERGSFSARKKEILNYDAIRRLLLDEREGHQSTTGMSDKTTHRPDDEQKFVEQRVSPWNMDALEAIFAAFLAPRPSALSPTKIDQTAPSAKQLFWLVLAFDKLSGGDSRTIMDKWEAVENKFDETRSRQRGKHESWKGYTGPVGDRRLERMLAFHAKKVTKNPSQNR